MNQYTPVAIAIIAAVVALAGIVAWRSVMRKKLEHGGTFTFTFWNHTWKVPEPPEPPVPPVAADKPSGSPVPGFEASS